MTADTIPLIRSQFVDETFDELIGMGQQTYHLLAFYFRKLTCSPALQVGLDYL